jgi:hypothetical protein
MICIPMFIAMCFNLFIFSIQLTFGKDIFSFQYYLLQTVILDWLLAGICIVFEIFISYKLDCFRECFNLCLVSVATDSRIVKKNRKILFPKGLKKIKFW